MIRTALVAAAVVVGSARVNAAVIVPDSVAAPFEDWSRGFFGSTYAEWDVFSSAFGSPNLPDAGEVELADATLLQGTPGAVLTGGGNIYSPAAAAQLAVAIPQLASAPVGTTRIVAQVQSLGATLDAGSVFLTPANGVANPPMYSTLAATGVGFGAVEQHLFAWDVAADADGYVLTFAGSGPHFSLDQVVIDTYTQNDGFSAFPLGAPEPAAALLLALGGAASLTQRSRVS
ncbi:hypothetical protein Pla123a_23940 [Posidoniimonas polymericola]|uniref:PEP-CTERM protein-sorting domain-containing protein n=2 Tax=Posidoniimonas polymericola TaxID=2528002 RepID=A0A5C5YQ57_9BACT|nr:hypothetical protein Pla123a_23940 [Posidoniimonas polymericola]